MIARRGTAGDGVAAAEAQASRTGARPTSVAACVVLLLFLLVPAFAGAATSDGLVPGSPDLPVQSLLPSPDGPLKVTEPLNEVVNGITQPSPSPPPQGSGEPGPDPTPGGGGDRGRGRGGTTPGQRPDGRGGASPGSATAQTAHGNVPRSDSEPVPVPVVRQNAVWHAVSPSLGTLATRARNLVAPLAAPMGLGVVAVTLLGLATRGPGVISKLNEELESADGRQVWRL